MIRINVSEQLGRVRTGRPRWMAWLAMAASLVVGVSLFLLAASLALILIPIVLVVGAIAMWRLKARLKAAGFGQRRPFEEAPRQAERVDVIDAEYRIVDPKEPPRR